MKKIFFIIFFFATSCGYQPLFVKENNSELKFKQIQLLGDKDINRRIISMTSMQKNKDDDSLDDILINSKESIVETSKNAQGRVTTLKTNIEIIVIISNTNGEERERAFNESFTYDNKENKFDLAKYQKEIKNNLVNDIIEKLIVYLNLK
tara:strand:+ start:281 stop:730 length:450 start_codon:yes stop_codon:yes gene_type:complete